MPQQDWLLAGAEPDCVQGLQAAILPLPFARRRRYAQTVRRVPVQGAQEI